MPAAVGLAIALTAAALAIAGPGTLRPAAAATPQAAPDFAIGIHGQSQLLAVLENDRAAGSALAPATVRLVESPAQGRAYVLPDGRIHYEAPAQAGGRFDRMRYTVQDASGVTSAPTSVTVALLRPPRLMTSTRAIDFAEACPPECEHTVTLTNEGEAPIYVVGAVLPEGTGYTASGCEQATLTGTQPTCTIRVRSGAATASGGSASLRIHHSTGAAIEVELTGGGALECTEAVPANRLALLDQRVGFGRAVTGGAAGCLYRVTNANDSGPGSLRAGAEAGNAWIVFDRDVRIQLQSDIDIAGNTTIDGRGRDVVIEGRGLHVSGADSSNVILENLTIRHAAGAGNDLVRVWRGASGFWLDHLTLADADDEYIDIGSTDAGREAPVLGTISWVHFEPGGPVSTNDMAVIIGAEAGARTNRLLHVTLHHNWYDGTRQRHPLVNGGVVHSFNNLIRWRLWGVAVRHWPGDPSGTQFLSERDVFDASDAPSGNRAAVRFTQSPNQVLLSEPLLTNSARLPDLAEVAEFELPELYPYRLDATERVREIVTAGAGAR